MQHCLAAAPCRHICFYPEFPHFFTHHYYYYLYIHTHTHTHTRTHNTRIFSHMHQLFFFAIFFSFFFVLLTTQKKAHKIYNACPAAFYLMMPFLRCQHGRKNSRLIFNARLNAATNKTSTPATTTRAATTNRNSRKQYTYLLHISCEQYSLSKILAYILL